MVDGKSEKRTEIRRESEDAAALEAGRFQSFWDSWIDFFRTKC